MPSHYPPRAKCFGQKRNLLKALPSQDVLMLLAQPYHRWSYLRENIWNQNCMIICSQGSLEEKSAEGYMTNELFKIFLKHLSRNKSQGTCLLIFDGTACHWDLSIVDISDSLGIHLYCLPSNTTHELQPLDKAVYRSFEHHWDAELLSFLDQNRDKKLTKARFNIILSSVWYKHTAISRVALMRLACIPSTHRNSFCPFHFNGSSCTKWCTR